MLDPIFSQIRKTVTHIIHIGKGLLLVSSPAIDTVAAWRVDFNLSLMSFEDAIGGVRTLVDLALSSPRPDPPRIVFTSSVGVFRST